MRILSVGGGPAGLSAAASLAQASQAHDITVVERRGKHESRGWGVTLRNHALDFLGLKRLVQPQWLQGRRFMVRGECRLDLPNPPDACLITLPRDELIGALAVRCEERGVALHYGMDAGAIGAAQLRKFDLVVAADGARSRLCERWADVFSPRIEYGRNWYAWLATTQRFDKLTILFSDSHEPLLAWAYAYADGLSSFIVERQTFTDSSRAVQPLGLARNFAAELGGQRLLCAPNAHWSRFPLVRCERLHAENIVLIGDAAHTTHFSQGFGTMFAFEDACALNEALQGAGSVRDALEAYERAQQPRIEQFQSAADASRQWSERLLMAAGRGDETALQAAIAARWPVNSAPPAPAPRRRLQHYAEVYA
jgi:2-polyprenyl-6-methoxyphenol hydroxylase-like FAD-dependent oxidoreductase